MSVTGLNCLLLHLSAVVLLDLLLCCLACCGMVVSVVLLLFLLLCGCACSIVASFRMYSDLLWCCCVCYRVALCCSVAVVPASVLAATLAQTENKVNML